MKGTELHTLPPEDPKNAIELHNISKKFKIYHNKESNLKYVLLNLLKGKRSKLHSEFWALKEVDIDIKKGQTVGFIGRNGSGKSTMLKLISKILYPDGGTIRTSGKLSTLIELGSGFHPELSGRENVYINASILGFSRAEVREKFDDIVKFSGLEEFIDNPVKTYSSGMYVRLGFSVAINIDPDILIVDEVLAVGDETFQKKCIRKINEFKEMGKTIVFVSHDLESVEKLCDRVFLMHNGQLITEGKPLEAISEYHKLLIGTSQKHLREDDRWKAGTTSGKGKTLNRWGSREIEITDVSFLDPQEKEVSYIQPHDGLRVRIHYKARGKVADPMFGLAIYTDTGVHITGPNTQMHHFSIPVVEGEGYIQYLMDSVPLLPGTYLFSAAAYDAAGLKAYDHWEQHWKFTVVENPDIADRGLIAIPSSWSIGKE